MSLLAFDTATAATVVGLRLEDGSCLEARHDPAAGERPGHASVLLALVDEVLGRGGLELAQLSRLGVGVGPGSFTGLRIGVATARALAQAVSIDLVAVGTLDALALGADLERCGASPVAAVLDARRGEAFAAVWRAGERLVAPSAVGPDALARMLAALPSTALAVGDGALRFRGEIEAAGARVPPDGDPLHRLGGGPLCRLAAGARDPGDAAVLPDYLRPPDAELTRRSPT